MVAEAALPVATGAVAALCAFPLAQRLLNGPLTVIGSWTTTTVVRDGVDATTEITHVHHGSVHVLPTDVAPGSCWALATLLLLPTAAVIVCWFASRRIEADPLAVSRRVKARRPPLAAAAITLLLSLSGLVGYSGLRSLLGQPNRATQIDVIVVVGLFSVAAGSLVVGVASVASHLGRWIADTARRPALLIAGRRLESDPYAVSRATALVLLALVVAFSGQAVKAHFLVITDPEDPLYADTLRLVDVAYYLALALACCGLALSTFEAMVARREQFEVQLAVGTPRRVLRLSVVLEALLPLVPGVIASSVIALLGVRGILGTGHAEVVGSGAIEHTRIVPIPIPWTSVAGLGLFVLFASGLVAALSFTALGPVQSPPPRD
nr:ABC transporter permease [Nocardioides marmorisolisilvae]